MYRYFLAIGAFALILGAGCSSTAPTDEMSPDMVSDHSLTQEVPMKLSSPAFAHEGAIPSMFTCDGSDINPALEVAGVPAEAQSLALIVDDPDAPGGTWLHWTMWNIDPATTRIEENSVPAGVVQGMTDFETVGWGGPCPPSGTHRYYFKLYALDMMLDLSSGASLQQLEAAMQGHILEQVELMGTYSI